MSWYDHLPAILCFIVFFYGACVIAIHGSFEDISTLLLRITWGCFAFVILWICFLWKTHAGEQIHYSFYLIGWGGIMCLLNAFIGPRGTLIAFAIMLQQGHLDREVAEHRVPNKDRKERAERK